MTVALVFLIEGLWIEITDLIQTHFSDYLIKIDYSQEINEYKFKVSDYPRPPRGILKNGGIDRHSLQHYNIHYQLSTIPIIQNDIIDPSSDSSILITNSFATDVDIRGISWAYQIDSILGEAEALAEIKKLKMEETARVLFFISL